MHVLLGERNADNLGIEPFFHCLVHCKINIPVISGLHPGTDREIHTAVPMIDQIRLEMDDLMIYALIP